MNLMRFGSLINTQTAFHIKKNSLLHRTIASYKRMPGEQEEHTVSGAVLMQAGIQLLPAEAEPADEQHMLGSSPTGTTVAVVQWLATCVRRFWKESL